MNQETTTSQPPRKIKARGMGQILSIAEKLKDDKVLGERVREIVKQVRAELDAYESTLPTQKTS